MAFPSAFPSLKKKLYNVLHVPSSSSSSTPASASLSFPLSNNLFDLLEYFLTTHFDHSPFDASSSSSDDDDDDDHFATNVLPPSNTPASGNGTNSKQTQIAILQSELLFLLSTLLQTKTKKSQVQNRYASIGVVDMLNKMIKHTDWFKKVPNVRRIHGENCSCNPYSARKLQILRLVLNFCDKDYKNASNFTRYHLFLNIPEHDLSLNNTGVESSIIFRLVQLFTQHGGVEQYKTATSNSHNISCEENEEQLNTKFVFWIGSCIEGFLRGSCNPRYQQMVADSGLLSYLVKQILTARKVCLNQEQTSNNSLQGNFDLLGELLKNNFQVFSRLQHLLVDEKDFQQFFEVVEQNLLDSNVFLRTLLLVIHHQTVSLSSDMNCLTLSSTLSSSTL
eukprot:CAMPEP_0201549708 /NCGR_PEP_ID=MMETSP0173_2-20130828/6160_1 /ASSEMBLY_ACC=CAM_ASM_000268 /TAXON_ID=218659 /ORGANISM="Vexillifera sp., Strain DIVA3 564/2" /LENGTH=391 /DNA_ID=CAMNT_0047959477 /DNA_START=50 /DNA_END=1222 /DNA_ORIENTATION=+